MATLYVKEQGSKLRVERERLVVTRGEERLVEVPAIKVDRVVIMGRGVQVSTSALVFLAGRGVPIVFTNRAGTRVSATAGAMSAHNGPLRVAQVRSLDDPRRSLELVRAVVSGKLANQQALLREEARLWGDAGKAAVAGIERVRGQAPGAKNVEQLRGYEGVGAALYWRAWSSLLQESWGFAGREYHPPRDPINAMLSFGYTLLLNEVTAVTQEVGLDPSIGFFHTLEQGRPSLALDMMEEFRPMLVDILVLRLLASRTITRADFVKPQDKPEAVYLNEAGRARFIQAYEAAMQARVTYPHTPNGKAQAETWRRCISLQAQQLARTLLGNQPGYWPLLWPGGA